jgi:ABC-type molybdate transport system permease subunit
MRSIAIEVAQPKSQGNEMLILPTLALPLAAIGYSLVYLLGGGGFLGAIVIFLVAKMLGD